MHKVKPIIAPVPDGCHSHQPPCGRQRHELPLAETAGAVKPACVSRAEMPVADGNVQVGTASGHGAAQLIGEAGANLVLSRLQSWGIAAQPAMPSLPYDLIADVPHFDMLRIQVKTRSKPNGGRCSFRMRRGFYRSKSGTFPYQPDDFDIAAFACLSLNAVFFYAGRIKPISVRTSWLRSPDVDRATLELAIEAIQHRRLTDKLAWLASSTSDTAVTIAASPARDVPPEQAEFDFGPRS